MHNRDPPYKGLMTISKAPGGLQENPISHRHGDEHGAHKDTWNSDRSRVFFKLARAKRNGGGTTLLPEKKRKRKGDV